jgi:hypothetical protein
LGVQHEGDRLRICHEDGSFDDPERESLAAPGHAWSGADEPITFSGLAASAAEVGASLGGQQERAMFQAVARATAAAGNVVDAHGACLTAALVLDGLESIELGFDDLGNPIWPSICVNPALADDVGAALRAIDDTPALSERFRAMIERKRSQWHAREADRRLVD